MMFDDDMVKALERGFLALVVLAGVGLVSLASLAVVGVVWAFRILGS